MKFMKKFNFKPKIIANIILILFFVYDGQQINAQTVDQTNLFHSNIHNFYFNESAPSQPFYLMMEQHAAAMSYDGVINGLTQTLPGNLNSLKRIMPFNTYYVPGDFNFAAQTVTYPLGYMNINNSSTINLNDTVYSATPITQQDITLLQGLGCALNPAYKTTNSIPSLAVANQLYYIDSTFNKVMVNWQSKYVVQQLANKLINTLQTKRWDYLFMDEVTRYVNVNCLNKSYGGMGTYPTWMAGKIAFMQLVNNAAHHTIGNSGFPMKVFANIWSPYADVYSPVWYSTNLLRFDHYYWESGGQTAADTANNCRKGGSTGQCGGIGGQNANGIDPETGLPAIFSAFNGYIPANKISVSTKIADLMNVAANDPIDPNLFAIYLNDQYVAAGTAAAQGSWFGWYGVNSVIETTPAGTFIHNNAMQLLRAIPNWENLAKLPLSTRSYNFSTNIYSSPRSYFSNSVVSGWNPINNQIYTVFNDTVGTIDLNGQTLASAYFVDQIFNTTSENALPCLNQTGQTIQLSCADHIGRGIRFTLQ